MRRLREALHEVDLPLLCGRSSGRAGGDLDQSFALLAKLTVGKCFGVLHQGFQGCIRLFRSEVMASGPQKRYLVRERVFQRGF